MVNSYNIYLLKENILRSLNELSVEERFKTKIIMNESFANKLTSTQLKELKEFAKTETSNRLHVTPYIKEDIILHIRRDINPVIEINLI